MEDCPPEARHLEFEGFVCKKKALVISPLEEKGRGVLADVWSLGSYLGARIIEVHWLP